MTVEELRRATAGTPWLEAARVRRQTLWAFVILPGFLLLAVSTLPIVLPTICAFDLLVAGLVWLRERVSDGMDRVERFHRYAEWRAS